MKLEETTLKDIILKLEEFGMTKSEAQDKLLKAFERAETNEAVYIWNEYIEDNDNKPLYKFIFKCQILYGKYHWFILTKE